MYEIDKKKFGVFVASLRKEKGYTQKELAQKLFISDKAISKWETGISIPDTAILVPLADLLGVSVTELLRCEKMETVLDRAQVEDVVQTAIRYSDERNARTCEKAPKWMLAYILSLLVGSILLWVNYRMDACSPCLLTTFILGAVFGVYYCFFARTRLPSYYDEHKISGVYDGVFRMNVPGLYFNNSNWKYIILVCRIWACAAMVLYPLVSMGLSRFSWWNYGELYVMLALVLGGLFIPAYVVGKKNA